MAFFDLFDSKKRNIVTLLNTEYTIWIKAQSYSILENVFYKHIDTLSPNDILVESLHLLMAE